MMRHAPPPPSLETVTGPPSRNGEARRAERLAENGIIQCIAITLILIGALIAVD